MQDCHRSSKMVQQLVFIILSKIKLMFEILGSQSPEFQSREICTDFHTSLLITSGTCLFLSKGMRLRFQKCTQMCLFWYLVATLDTLYILSLYYHFSHFSYPGLWDPLLLLLTAKCLTNSFNKNFKELWEMSSIPSHCIPSASGSQSQSNLTRLLSTNHSPAPALSPNQEPGAGGRWGLCKRYLVTNKL